MDHAKFFAGLRARGSGIFGTSLNQSQVAGINALLASCARNGVTHIEHVSNILAQVYHETGARMSPVRETFAASDAQAIARLEQAWKAGKLSWVKTPYWRDGWYGRGPIQLTHEANYRKFEQRLGVPLTKYRELAMDPAIGADIAVVGMKEGLFTGRKLADFSFPAALGNPPSSNPRRIVNGNDGTDRTVAGYHNAFRGALAAAGYSSKAAPAAAKPAPTPVPTPKPAAPAPAAPKGGFWTAFLRILRTIVRGGQ